MSLEQDRQTVLRAVQLMIASKARPSEWYPVADGLADMMARLYPDPPGHSEDTHAEGSA